MSFRRTLLGVVAAWLVIFPAAAADNSMFNYQGRVLVQGFPYTGSGQIKAAILATTGTGTVESLWSNDGSSEAGSEPVSSIPITAASGVFDAMIGDANAGLTIPAVLFNRDDELKVRVWFNDGTHGFQQLSPDRRITNPRRLGATRITAPLTVYVNPAGGDDLRGGLTTDTAKRTVQAALDMLPRSIYATTTIKLAPGTYPSFTVTGFNDMMSELVILGDAAHDPTLSQPLNVIVNATASAGILVNSSVMIRLKGIQAQNGYTGFDIKGSQVELDKCEATNCYFMGFLAEGAGRMGLNNCLAYHNTQYGIGYVYSTGGLTSTISDGNQCGLMVYHNSSVACVPATLRNNQTGLISRYLSSTVLGSINYSGNVTNTNIGAGSGIY